MEDVRLSPQVFTKGKNNRVKDESLKELMQEKGYSI